MEVVLLVLIFEMPIHQGKFSKITRLGTKVKISAKARTPNT